MIEDSTVSKQKDKWSKDFYGSTFRFINENSENITHVEAVVSSIENLKNVLQNNENYLRIMDIQDNGETDREVYLNIGDRKWELIAQVALDEEGQPIDDGSAWYEVGEFDEIIRHYSEKLDDNRLDEEDGGAIGSEVTSGEGLYEPLSVRGYTKLTTKKPKKKKGKLTSMGGNKYKTY